MPNICTLITALLVRLWFFRYHMSQHSISVQSLFMHTQVCVWGGEMDVCVCTGTSTRGCTKKKMTSGTQEKKEAGL